MNAAETTYTARHLERFTESAPEMGVGWRKDPFTGEVLYSDLWLDEEVGLALVQQAPRDGHSTSPGPRAEELPTVEGDRIPRPQTRSEAQESIARNREALRDDLAEGRVHGSGPWPPRELQVAWARQTAADSLRRAAKNVEKLAGWKPDDREFLTMVAAAVAQAATEVEEGVDDHAA